MAAALFFTGCVNNPKIIPVDDEVKNKTTKNISEKALTKKNFDFVAKVEKENEVQQEIKKEEIDFIKIERLIEKDKELVFEEITLDGYEFNSKTVYRLTMKNTVNFNTNSAELSEAVEEKINTFANIYQNYFSDQKKLLLVGHTDSDGTIEYNESLALRRVASVANHLKKNGLREENLILLGMGPHRPVAPNDSDENKLKNRRVEFYVSSSLNQIKRVIENLPCETSECQRKDLGFYSVPQSLDTEFELIENLSLKPILRKSLIKDLGYVIREPLNFQKIIREQIINR
ncbi:OmpA family protein [Thiomicrospira sp. ALE5]|uniref:OmpA family protein n=1 Tax=Thiomicrospira sp. ALE5 TaxID=748650 RepID=UPI0013566B6D|nr:OmpA family protein [Thiomicrospira sp. ALE5]